MKKNVLNLIYLSFLFVSCVSTAPSRQRTMAPAASPASRKLYQEAQTAFDNQKESVAEKKLTALLKTDPASDVADDAHILLGRMEFRKKQYAAAYNHFQSVFAGPHLSPRDAEARILGAQSLIALNKESQADTLIRDSLKMNLEPKERAYLLEAHLPLLLKKGSQVETFEALAYLSQHHPNSSSRERFKSLAQEFIDSHLTPDELKSLAEEDGLGDLRAEAMFKLAMGLVHEDKLDQAKYYFGRVSSMAPNTYLGKQSANMIKQLEARAYVETKSVGVILPLSGPYAPIGEQTLKGLKLALGISGTQSQNGIRLIIEDSKGTAEDAARAIEDLVLKEHVIAIVGGLSAKNVVAEATKAQDLGVPFFALSQKPELTKIGPFIFNGSITPKLQVEYLVSYAMDRLGFKRFAVLFPNDRYGVEFANLYWDEVLRRGGRLTVAQAYSPGETDFKTHIKKMVGTYYLEDRQDEYSQLLQDWKKNNKSSRKTPPETLLPPVVDFDVLFIPDDLKALGQIAPMLAFNDVNDVTLLGTNLWDSPEFEKRAQSFAEKAIFVDSHLASSETFANSPFVKNYKGLYNERPGSFAVTGYDAGILTLNALKLNPHNRVEYLQSLSSLKKIPGAVGPLSVLEDHEVDRQLLPLSSRKGQVIILE
ncbi:MAG: penicillin-binding protein activator [Bdellovibrionaceae bacterium]|nr:penicillin-binding protein activator [Pseudobdellovibrionaceae bacterium]